MDSVNKTPDRLIKKYPNRRLYDTRTSAYVTLADVRQMILDNESLSVIDAKSGADLTRAILLQIVLEEEAGSSPLFSRAVLTQIIRHYGQAMQAMMGAYLEKNIQTFVDIQNRLLESAKDENGGKPSDPELSMQLTDTHGSMMQGVMSNYIEQSKHLFVQMQQQIRQQTRQQIRQQTQTQPSDMSGTFPFGATDSGK